MRRFLGYLVLGALLLGAGVGYATGTAQEITVTFRGINLKVNGHPVATEQEPFVYDRRTYVPLRLVAEALGHDVSWDDASSTISINGRVYIKSVSAHVIKGSLDWTNDLAFSGILVNDTDREISDISLRCSATDNLGKTHVDHTTLQGRLKAHGGVSFSFKKPLNDKVVISFNAVSCKVLHSSGADS